MEEVLVSLSHDVVAVSAQIASLDSIATSRPALLIIDLHIDGDPRKGWDVAMAAHQHPGLDETPLVLCTGDHAFLRQREEQIRALPYVHPLPKPFSIEDVDQLLGRLLERSDSSSS